MKPEYWQDEKLAPLDALTRLVFLGLISMADDLGRVVDSVKSIDGFLFSLTDDSARESLAKLCEAGRIQRGITASGQAIIQIVNWSRHQKVDHPNIAAALPEIVTPLDVTGARDSFANRSRGNTESFAPHTNDQRSTTSTNDLRSTSSSGHKAAAAEIPTSAASAPEGAPAAVDGQTLAELAGMDTQAFERHRADVKAGLMAMRGKD